MHVHFLATCSCCRGQHHIFQTGRRVANAHLGRDLSLNKPQCFICSFEKIGRNWGQNLSKLACIGKTLVRVVLGRRRRAGIK